MVNNTIMAVYKCMLGDGCSVYDWTRTISFVRRYTDCDGKVLCSHQWKQFEVTAMNYFEYEEIDIRARCVKCGKIGQKRTKYVMPVESMLDKKSWVFIA